MTEATCEKILLMLAATAGIRAPQVTATNPAIRAYSIKSWPRRSVANAIRTDSELEQRIPGASDALVSGLHTLIVQAGFARDI